MSMTASNGRKAGIVTLGQGIMFLVDEAQLQGLVEQKLVALCDSCPAYHLTAITKAAMLTGFALDLTSVLEATPAPLDATNQARLDELLKRPT